MTDFLTVSAQATDRDQRLVDITNLRLEMEERFHLYTEVQALPPEARDALFRLLWDAQAGDTKALQAVFGMVYDEVPVGMEEFVLSRKYLGFQGNIDAAKVEILLKFAEPQLRIGYLAIGSGAGKSLMVSIALAYQVYCLLCLRRPDLFYCLSPGSKIAAINLSINKAQAKDVVFSEFLARLDHSPWFKGKYKAQLSRAFFPKKIAAISGGASPTAFYGYHTIFGAVDEASFLMDGERCLAEELVEALKKSLSTRFPRAYKLFVVSTLRAQEDFLYQQIQRIKDSGVCLLKT